MVADNQKASKDNEYTKFFYIEEECIRTTRLGMENRWGYNQLPINEIVVFRIELPCYPKMWTEHLYLETEVMILIDPVVFTYREIFGLEEVRDRGLTLRRDREVQAAAERASFVYPRLT